MRKIRLNYNDGELSSSFDVVDIEDIVKALSIPYSIVNLSLIELELAGKIERIYGNKVYYIESGGQFCREFADPREAPVDFESKDQMFREWSTLEELTILDTKILQEYKRSKHYG